MLPGEMPAYALVQDEGQRATVIVYYASESVYIKEHREYDCVQHAVDTLLAEGCESVLVIWATGSVEIYTHNIA